MTFKKTAALAAAASLVASPALAQSATAQSVKAAERISAKQGASNELGESADSGVLIGVLAFAAVVGGIFLLAEETDSPTSP